MEHIFRQWIGMHRAMIAWFHAAHHVTKGTGFGGDHVNIYGRIYTELEEDFDEIVEKGLGLTGDETLADPASILSLAAGQLSQYPQPANQDAEQIARNALEIARVYIAFIESIYSQFEGSGGMTLGLDDQLQGFANKYETYVYLLQQRSRHASNGMVPVMEGKFRKALRRVIQESAGFTICNDGDEIWDAIDDEGEAYAEQGIAEEWMDSLGPSDRKDMTLDTRITIIHDEQGNERQCVKITDRTYNNPGVRWVSTPGPKYQVMFESSFTVYSERGKYIESSDGSLLQLASMDEPKIIVSNGRERGSLVLHRGGRIYFQTNRRDQFFSNLQELCDYLNKNGFQYEGIDDY